ncbi:MAG: RNA chaperone Hfq [Candidatus Riflebacteria bacterium]|nr:RNA chaperone Hfq [Candidatus Riflebacteria bacterium]
MSQYKSQIQNMFLSQARKKHQKVEMVLETGTVLRGKLKAYDQFSVTLGFKDQSEVIYKSSIIYMTILPALHTPTSDRRPRYNSRDNGYRRDDGYRRNFSNDDYEDESDEKDFEENTRALNSYRKLGDDTDNYRRDSYRRDEGDNYRRDGGYRRENNYRRDDGEGYRNNYRRDDSESYRNNYRRNDSEGGYRRDNGYRKYDNNGYRRNYDRDDDNERHEGYQKPYSRRRDEDYDSKPTYQKRPYNKRDDEDNDPPPPKKVIVKRY